MRILTITAPKAVGKYSRSKDPVKKFFQDVAGGEGMRSKAAGKKPTLKPTPWGTKQMGKNEVVQDLKDLVSEAVVLVGVPMCRKAFGKEA